MWPDRVLNSGPLALESDTLQTALRPGHSDLHVLSDH